MKPRLGDRAFEVEWCYELPLDEFGDANLDCAKQAVRYVPTHEEALAVAKKVFPKDQFGSVRITPVEYTDPFGDRVPSTYLWEAHGESEFYDGD